MRALINASTLSKGGGMQVAASLFADFMRMEPRPPWHWVISPALAAELSRAGLGDSHELVSIVSPSPAQSLRARRSLGALEHALRPDVVFTIFGPAYVDFEAPHLCGVADGWVTHATARNYRHLRSIRSALRIFLKVLYKSRWYRRADAWVVEADVARRGLVDRFRFPRAAIHVVPNTCGMRFLRQGGRRPFPAGRAVRILCMSAYYPHKNLEIIPRVALELRRLLPDRAFEFVLTLPADGEPLRRITATAAELSVADRIDNIGPVPVFDAPAVYQASDVAFLPSLLETSSANFPEAMAMGLPIVTTDLDFSRSSCGDAALYFRSEDPLSAARALATLLQDSALWERQIEAGKTVLASLPAGEARLVAYAQQMSELVAAHRPVMAERRRLSHLGASGR